MDTLNSTKMSFSKKEKKEKCRVENNDVERVQKLRGPIVSLPETEIMLLFYCTSAFSVFKPNKTRRLRQDFSNDFSTLLSITLQKPIKQPNQNNEQRFLHREVEKETKQIRLRIRSYNAFLREREKQTGPFCVGFKQIYFDIFLTSVSFLSFPTFFLHWK